jgi:pantoate--beta-alanine ligase
MTHTSIAIIRELNALRAQIADWRAKGQTIALVPTMGALHDGHIGLGRLARAHADRVVYSIFVNPTQFAPHEDLDRYPRDEAGDAAKLTEAGFDLIYTPNANDMYGENPLTKVMVSGITQDLEGAIRPHFFGGVATVVTKLFTRVAPDIAVFGEKDYQQLLCVRQLVRDLDLPLTIIGAPTAREADGLAQSSRNAYLTEDQRRVACHLNLVMKRAIEAVGQDQAIDPVLARSTSELLDLGFGAVDYFTLRDAQSLSPITDLAQPARLLAAVRLGAVRLIDNMAVSPKSGLKPDGSNA